MKLKMVIELEYDEDLMGTSDDERNWFNDIVLKGATHKNKLLILHSNEIGDEIGTIEVKKIL